jgi:hypothetical protein
VPPLRHVLPPLLLLATGQDLICYGERAPLGCVLLILNMVLEDGEVGGAIVSMSRSHYKK